MRDAKKREESEGIFEGKPSWIQEGRVLNITSGSKRKVPLPFMRRGAGLPIEKKIKKMDRRKGE